MIFVQVTCGYVEDTEPFDIYQRLSNLRSMVCFVHNNEKRELSIQFNVRRIDEARAVEYVKYMLSRVRRIHIRSIYSKRIAEPPGKIRMKRKVDIS